MLIISKAMKYLGSGLIFTGVLSAAFGLEAWVPAAFFIGGIIVILLGVVLSPSIQ